jgi:hypothetical protein
VKKDFFLTFSRFMERVKNGNCSISNKIGEKYLKCGPLYEYNRDVIAYPNYFPLCYSFSDRQIFSENNFRTRYLFPISLYGYSIVPTVLFGFEFIIILCVMVEFLTNEHVQTVHHVY